jgi:hypothetical protein
MPIIVLHLLYNIVNLMSREILRQKLYSLIKNIEDESILIEISNYLDKIKLKENQIDFDTEDLADFLEGNKNILDKE